MTKKQIDDMLLMSNRFETFLNIFDKVNGANYWHALRLAYLNSDNVLFWNKAVKVAFLKDEPQKDKLMTISEHRFLNSLPDTITIYQGVEESEYYRNYYSNNYGVSWTLQKEIAAKSPMYHELTINRNDVLTYFSKRKEIIYIPV